jgi:hypothetical protein
MQDPAKCSRAAQLLFHFAKIAGVKTRRDLAREVSFRFRH